MRAGERPRHRRKAIAAIVVAAILGTSGFYVWYEYYRHWSIEDVENAVILDEESGEFYPVILGFKDKLDGRTVTVDIEVGSIRTWGTNRGQLNMVYPEGGTLVAFMLWGPLDFGAGDRVGIDVTFERSVINGNEGVYSPQIGLPGFGILAQVQEVIHSVSWVFSEFVFALEESEGQLRVEVEKASEPVPLAMSRCSLRAGVHTEAEEYMDVLGWYSGQPDIDTMPSLLDSEGINGTIKFSDLNADGYLDDGDHFTLLNLTRPDTASGTQTYLFTVQREKYPEEYEAEELHQVLMVYIIMTEDGFLLVTDGQSPTGRSYASVEPDCLSMTLDYMSLPVSWDDIKLLAGDGNYFAEFTPDSAALSTGSPSSYSCGVSGLRDLELECVVSDISGNGFADAGDVIEFHARNGTHFNETRDFDLRVIYAPVGTEITRETIDLLAWPESECLLSTGDDFVTATLNPMYNGTDRSYERVDVIWTDVMVRVTDGDNETGWNMSFEDLDGGEPVNWTSAEQTLGNLSLICTVVDLQGNGLANAGDRITVAVTDGGAYAEATTYTITLVHAPTGADIFIATFTG